jgi:hypothetical protein
VEICHEQAVNRYKQQESQAIPSKGDNLPICGTNGERFTNRSCRILQFPCLRPSAFQLSISKQSELPELRADRVRDGQRPLRLHGEGAVKVSVV